MSPFLCASVEGLVLKETSSSLKDNSINTFDEGQDHSVWNRFYKKRSPEQEISMYDFFGGRHLLLRHVCRHGKLVEAGCGLGRYVFYLSQFGIECEGVDFSEESLQNAIEFGRQHHLPGSFLNADILNLPYESNSIATYLSLGVVEHFFEGPQKALAEAFRVLRPGGIAIITTPAKSWVRHYYDSRFTLAVAKRKLLKQPIPENKFFQYWYTMRELKRFIRDAGFIIGLSTITDYIYPFFEFGTIKENNVPLIVKLFATLERHLYIPILGAQNVVVAIKPSDTMYCFISGKREAKMDDLNDFYLPISKSMKNHSVAKYYRKPARRCFPQRPYQWNTPRISPQERTCTITGKKYVTDPIFEDYGLSIDVSPEILRILEYNIKISFEEIQLRWRR